MMTAGLAEMVGARYQKSKGCVAGFEKEVGRGDSNTLTGHLARSATVGA